MDLPEAFVSFLETPFHMLNMQPTYGRISADNSWCGLRVQFLGQGLLLLGVRHLKPGKRFSLISFDSIFDSSILQTKGFKSLFILLHVLFVFLWFCETV